MVWPRGTLVPVLVFLPSLSLEHHRSVSVILLCVHLVCPSVGVYDPPLHYVSSLPVGTCVLAHMDERLALSFYVDV